MNNSLKTGKLVMLLFNCLLCNQLFSVISREASSPLQAAAARNNANINLHEARSKESLDDAIVIFSESKNDESKKRAKDEGIKFDKSTGKVSVKYHSVSVVDLVRELDDIYGLNVILPEGINQNVYVNLKNVDWEQVFNVVLNQVGYTYIQKNGIISIVSVENLEKEPLQVDIIKLDKGDAKSVAEKFSKTFIDKKGGGSASHIDDNTIIIKAKPNELQSIKAALKKLDQVEKQVQIQAKFIEVSSSKLREMGFDFGETFNPLTFSMTAISREYAKENGAFQKKDMANFSLTNFNYIFKMVKEDKDSRVISEPSIVTKNNTPAAIKVGESIPIPKYQYNSEKAVYEVNGFDYKDVGVTLNVIPKIKDEFITLALKPSLADVKTDTEFGKFGNVSIPVLYQKTTESIVTVKSGGTIAIGGLLSRKTGKSTKKLPILGDIPILGSLFTSKYSGNGNNGPSDYNNLLIFITATQIDASGNKIYDAPFEGVKNVEQKRLLDMGVTDEMLPGYRCSKEENKLFEESRQLKQSVSNELRIKELEKSIEQQKGTLEKLKERESDLSPGKKSKRLRRRRSSKKTSRDKKKQIEAKRTVKSEESLSKIDGDKFKEERKLKQSESNELRLQELEKIIEQQNRELEKLKECKSEVKPEPQSKRLRRRRSSKKTSRDKKKQIANAVNKTQVEDNEKSEEESKKIESIESSKKRRAKRLKKKTVRNVSNKEKVQKEKKTLSEEELPYLEDQEINLNIK